MNEGFRNIPIENEPNKEKGLNKSKKTTRRNFIKNAVKFGVATAVTGGVASKLLDGGDSGENTDEISLEVKELAKKIKEEQVRSEVDKIADEYAKESEMASMTPMVQIERYGRIIDLEKGIKALEYEHYKKLTEDEKGKRDMQVAVKNMSKVNLSKMIKPFSERGLPEELAYMIAIQETRGRTKTSWAGARGMTGIMPATAKALGFKPKDADNPYKAMEMTAKYLEAEKKDRFENDTNLLLHAYNAGGGLFGFTRIFSKEERTAENFYKYMEYYINFRLREVKENGYYVHTVDKKDKNITSISKRFKVSVQDILKENGFTESTIIHRGDKIKIPYSDMNKAAKVLFRKQFEALDYAPELRAKYNALKDLGLLERLQANIRATGSVV